MQVQEPVALGFGITGLAQGPEIAAHSKGTSSPPRIGVLLVALRTMADQ
jgi:hypothetical protein